MENKSLGSIAERLEEGTAKSLAKKGTQLFISFLRGETIQD